jgi:hypothetical protein
MVGKQRIGMRQEMESTSYSILEGSLSVKAGGSRPGTSQLDIIFFWRYKNRILTLE